VCVWSWCCFYSVLHLIRNAWELKYAWVLIWGSVVVSRILCSFTQCSFGFFLLVFSCFQVYAICVVMSFWFCLTLSMLMFAWYAYDDVVSKCEDHFSLEGVPMVCTILKLFDTHGLFFLSWFIPFWCSHMIYVVA